MSRRYSMKRGLIWAACATAVALVACSASEPDKTQDHEADWHESDWNGEDDNGNGNRNDNDNSDDDSNDNNDSSNNNDNSIGAGEWQRANLTNYTSYPEPGSEECEEFNGCTWAGQFAALPGTQPIEWVMANNIVAVHEKDFAKYKLKTLRLRQGNKTIDAKVYDMCSDRDCEGCCTANARETGFLIDIESFTMERFGSGDGVVEWMCLDC